MEVAICKDSGHGSEYLTQIMRHALADDALAEYMFGSYEKFAFCNLTVPPGLLEQASGLGFKCFFILLFFEPRFITQLGSVFSFQLTYSSSSLSDDVLLRRPTTLCKVTPTQF